jgi:endonuclease/exonuclease/phosphatase family metal-dependent hydrolase
MSLKILSFNILADMHIDFGNIKSSEYSGLSPAKLRMRNRYRTILNHLRNIDPDIALLQEVTTAIRARLVKDFKDYKVTKISMHKDYKSGNVFMVRKSIMVVVDGLLYHVKGGAYGILHIKYENSDIMIVNVHLNDVNGNTRNSEISYLLNSIIREHEKVIIGGDFNTDSTFSHDKLRRQGFLSVVDTDKEKGTYLCESPMIDYIYVRGMKVSKGYIFKGRCEEICDKECLVDIGSDHYPVVGILE